MTSGAGQSLWWDCPVCCSVLTASQSQPAEWQYHTPRGGSHTHVQALLMSLGGNLGYRDQHGPLSHLPRTYFCQGPAAEPGGLGGHEKPTEPCCFSSVERTSLLTRDRTRAGIGGSSRTPMSAAHADVASGAVQLASPFLSDSLLLSGLTIRKAGSARSTFCSTRPVGTCSHLQAHLQLHLHQRMG